MEACPFCGGEVDEQVVLYGGTCPHCFGHIPGEEAATDPGDDVRQAEEAQDRKRAKRRLLIPIIAAAAVALLVAGGALALVLQPEPELAVLDLDAGEYYTPELDGLIVAQTDPPPTTEAVENGGGTAAAGASTDPGSHTTSGSSDTRIAAAKTGPKSDGAPTIRRPSLNAGGSASDADLLSGLGTAESEDIARTVKTGGDLTPSSLNSDLELKSGMSTGGTLGGGGMALDMGSISQSGPPLSSQQQIALMVTKVLRRQLPRLRPCYENSLRANPGFGGSWVLTFTVETDGSLGHAKAVGKDMQDAEFEQCLLRRMEGWRFKRVVKPQPFKKTVDFKR